MRLRQTGERTNEHVLVFLRRQPADIEKDRLRRRQAETAARLVAAAARRRRLEPVLDQDHRPPITRGIAGELGPGGGAVYDIGGIQPERAGEPIDEPRQPRHLAWHAGLVNDAKLAAGQPADHAGQDGRRRLISDQRVETAAPDVPHHMQRARELGVKRQPGARIQIGGFDGEAVRAKSVFDHAGKFLHAAAFTIVQDLQNTHRIALAARLFLPHRADPI